MRPDPLLSLLEFVISPTGLLALVAVFLVLPMFIGFPLYWGRHARRLKRVFGGRITYPAANLIFEYRGRPVRLQRTAALYYGSYPTLTLGTSLRGKLFIGNPEATRYGHIDWLRSPRQTIVVDGRQLLVGSTSEALQRAAARELTTLKPGDLFEREFASLRIPAAHEYVSRTFPAGTTASFYGVDERIYAEPQRLQIALDRLCAILEWAETVAAAIAVPARHG